MNILPFKLKSTNEQLTSRAGILLVAQLMKQLQLSKNIGSYFGIQPWFRYFNTVAVWAIYLLITCHILQLYDITTFSTHYRI